VRSINLIKVKVDCCVILNDQGFNFSLQNFCSKGQPLIGTIATNRNGPNKSNSLMI